MPRLLLAILGCFGAVLLGAIACGELLGLAWGPHGATALDSAITRWVVAHRGSGWTTLAHALSTVGSQTVLTPLVLLAAAALLARRRFAAAGFLIVAWGGAILLYSLTKYFVHRPRPPSQIWLTDVGRTTSFPSGHATQSLATFLALALFGAACVSKLRGIRWVAALLLAGGVGCSRVYLGVHWSTDVLAGWVIASVWIAVVLRLAQVCHADRTSTARRVGEEHAF